MTQNILLKHLIFFRNIFDLEVVEIHLFCCELLKEIDKVAAFHAGILVNSYSEFKKK